VRSNLNRFLSLTANCRQCLTLATTVTIQLCNEAVVQHCLQPNVVAPMCAWSAPFGHSGRIFGLAFHPQRADVIASASEDETVRVWSRDSSGTWQQASSKL
jgi:WD40 repeat protein